MNLKDATDNLSRRNTSERPAPMAANSASRPTVVGETSLIKGMRVPQLRFVLAFALAILVAASVLLVLLTYHFVLEQGPHCQAMQRHEQRECHRITRSGLCVPEVFGIMDEAYRPLWPGAVDLLIRSYFSPRLFLLGPLWASVELLWPRGIGKVILVLDEGDQRAETLVPSWVEVKYETNYLNLPGKILQQWSYGWADNYSSAPFIAILDDDVTFNLKVTPFLLFNLTSGVPFIIGSKEQGYYRETTRFFLGRNAYFANFMVALPFVQPRAALPLYREKIATLHPKAPGGYDDVMQWWAEHGGDSKEQIAHTVMGNFIYNFAPSMAEFALEWTDHLPVPRVGVHVPYTNRFQEEGGTPRHNLLNSTSFLVTASYYTQEALCFSFPDGEIPGCNDVPKEQGHIWRYAWDRELWRALRRDKSRARIMYQHHTKQLHCMYDELVKLSYGLSKPIRLKGSSQLGKRLRTKCLF